MDLHVAHDQTTKILPAKILPQNFEPCVTAIVDMLVASLAATTKECVRLSNLSLQQAW